MQTENSNLIAEKAIEIIEEIIGFSLNPEERDLVIRLEKNQDLFHESIFKIKEKRNEFTVALEAMYYLFFYDFDTKNIATLVNQNIVFRLKEYLSSSIHAILIQETEMISYFMEYLEGHHSSS